MKGDHAHRAASGIGALTRKDHYREAALNRKIDDAYRGFSTTPSARARRRHLRAARRHERALVAQRRRPQSVLAALAVALLVVFVVIAVNRVSLALALVVGALFVIDVRVMRRRHRKLRR